MTLLLGVLAASLVGSVHCAAMCGGFVCLYTGTGAARDGRSPSSAWTHLAYNGGRLVSYVALGLAAGALGARLDSLGNMARVERGAAIVAGVLMILWAAGMIAASLGFRPLVAGVPDWAKRGIGAVLLTLDEQPPQVRGGAMGLLTTLLPCGWLYTFVVTAGGTGHPIAGAAVMFAFWAGTLPLLFGVGLGLQQIARPFAKHLPVASAVVVFALGTLSIAGKLRPLVIPGAQDHSAHSHVAHVR